LALAESGVEVLERLLQADLFGVQFAHRLREPILSEVARIDIAGLGDELHRPHGGLVVSVGEHVDMGVSHALAVERTRRLREAAVG
jgi:hypothetical protein